MATQTVFVVRSTGDTRVVRSIVADVYGGSFGRIGRNERLVTQRVARALARVQFPQQPGNEAEASFASAAIHGVELTARAISVLDGETEYAKAAYTAKFIAFRTKAKVAKENAVFVANIKSVLAR